MKATTIFTPSLRETRPARSSLLKSALMVLLLSVMGISQGASMQILPAGGASGPPDSIPQGHYDTWCLFLVCNQQWLLPERSADLHHLYENFQAFGRAIGDNNYAVWFLKERKQMVGDTGSVRTDASSGASARRNGSTGTAPNFADSVDVERSVRFCKAFKLKPSSGPHILFLFSYPDFKKPTAGNAFALGGMSPSQISALLGKLTDELVIEGKVAPQAAAPKPDANDTSAASRSADAGPTAVAEPDALWIRILAATQKSIRDSGCVWHFKIAAGGVEANLQPCEGSH